MERALVYYKIINPGELPQYDNPVLDFFREEFPEWTVYDLDNYSDSLMFKYALDLIEKADEGFIIFDTLEPASIGKISAFFEKLIQNQSKLSVFIIGENSFLHQLLRVFPAEKVYQFQSQDEALASFRRLFVDGKH